MVMDYCATCVNGSWVSVEFAVNDQTKRNELNIKYKQSRSTTRFYFFYRRFFDIGANHVLDVAGSVILFFSMIFPGPHTLGRYPRPPQTPQRKKFLQKLLVKGHGPGYLPGVCG